MAENKYVDLDNLTYYDKKNKTRMTEADAAVLKSAKEYSDSLAVNYDSAGKAKTLVDALETGAVKTNTDAIKILNGEKTVNGSVKKMIDDAFNDFATKVSDNDVVDTYKELVDYAASHKTETNAIVKDVSSLKTKVQNLENVTFTALTEDEINKLFA